MVYLVGAGPGDPELITAKGIRCIASADVLVYDYLAAKTLLKHAQPLCECIYVGKKGGDHTLSQEGINALIVAKAVAGNVVTRLKGGDPFVFGRGGEEAEACRAAGVPVEVVPGISSALGAAAAAQIPLTHRDHASIVSFVAGQCKGLTDQDWSGLAGKGRTLVIFMGLATAAQISEKLIADGLTPDVPAAVIENATRSAMRVLRAPLAGLAALVRDEKVQSPALIVIGAVTAEPDNTIRALASDAAALEALQ
ncbi:MAG: uroporphyrinogen-III C-methyltransferase [Novosphingobium sp.]